MGRKIKRENRSCVDCSSSFSVVPSSKRKYCSKQCGAKHRGGFRPRAGSVRTGYYHEIFCGSTWELCWVIYAIDHDIKFIRFPKMLTNGDIRYYPDFLLSDLKTIVEIKGPRADMMLVAKKTALAEQHGYLVNLLTEDKMQPIFEYVKTKYQTSKYFTLYDSYKPKFNYKCSYCNTIFPADRKRKTVEIFCSRKCAGKYQGGNTGSNPVEDSNYA
jgi:hypothetical protein